MMAENTSGAIRVVIADDDPGMRMILRRAVERKGGFVIIAEAADGMELMRAVVEHKPELVFLDVEMPGKTGVECAREIQDINPQTMMIFATAHEKYMGDAFSVYAFDYLLKPFKLQRIEQTLQRVLTGYNKNDEPPGDKPPIAQAPKAPRRLMLRHKDGVSFVDMDDILLVQRENRQTVLYAKGGKRYITGDTLSEVEMRLDSNIFFRCHKSYIININEIDSIAPYGRWTFILKLKDLPQDALITHGKYEELSEMFR